MKYRKGINVSNATERELLRWQMEKVVKDSDSLEYSPDKWSESLARLNDSLEKSYAGLF